MDLITQIANCKNKISANNDTLRKLTKDNDRLFKSLMNMINTNQNITIPADKVERIRKELASDNWKNYSESYKPQSRNSR